MHRSPSFGAIVVARLRSVNVQICACARADALLFGRVVSCTVQIVLKTARMGYFGRLFSISSPFWWLLLCERNGLILFFLLSRYSTQCNGIRRRRWWWWWCRDQLHTMTKRSIFTSVDFCSHRCSRHSVRLHVSVQLRG